MCPDGSIGTRPSIGTVLNLLGHGVDNKVVIFGIGSVGMTAFITATLALSKQPVAVDTMSRTLITSGG